MLTWMGPWSANPADIMRGMGLSPSAVTVTRVAARPAPKLPATPARTTSRIRESSALPPPPTVQPTATTPLRTATARTDTAPAKR